jgi:hypothetical protein
MGDRRCYNDEKEAQQRKDLQVGRKAMNRTVSVDIEAFARIMTMMMFFVSVNLALDWKVDFLLAPLRDYLEEQSSHEEGGNDANQTTQTYAEALILDT